MRVRGKSEVMNLATTIMAKILGQKRLTWYQKLDWEEAIRAFQTPNLSYPTYYHTQHFHGIKDGYLNSIAAITYDPITAIASPPSEGWLRRKLLERIEGQPQTLLDLGCGTGSTTLLLKQKFPGATVMGLDLSPYMLVMAHHKAEQVGLGVHWLQGLAESTHFSEASFDVITISFLFHEMPPQISQEVLKESYRLLKPRGQLLILDGAQRSLRKLGFVIKLFREPYSQRFAQGDLTVWCHRAGFTSVQPSHLGLIHQLTIANKPPDQA
jgi:ubiquinone/menaquinone biosynthesis C-methylase UbiE